MTGKRFTITAVVLFALGIPASGADQTVPFDLRVGQSVHVVAVRTSSRLESVIRDRFYSTVTYVACGKDIGFDDVRAAGVPVLQPATLERLAVGQTPIISTDPLLRSEIEKAFTKKKKLKVAATPSGADLVLVAFGEYPIARLVIQGTKLVSAWRGYEDSSYSFETATVLAFLLPADVYRQTGTSTRQLSDAALWQGYTWIMNTGCNRSAQADAARELVGRFHEALRVWIKPKNQSEVLPRAAQSDPSKVGQGPPQLKTTPDTPAVPPLPWTSAKDAAIKVATNLVIVPVAVSDRAGGHVPDLTQGDFRIFEDDAEQKIDHFRTVETPFRVVLLLDSSASMRLKNEELSHAATAFVDQLQAQDRVMVVPFDSEVRLHSEFTNNRALLHEAISRIRTNLGTRLYDAVDLILTERLRQVDGRKAIVLFTDGVDTESRLTDMQRTIELA